MLPCCKRSCPSRPSLACETAWRLSAAICTSLREKNASTNAWSRYVSAYEPQPGGIYLVNVTGARFARGSFREVRPVHRLAYSFGWDGSEAVPPGSSLVEIDLIERDGGTLLRMTHSGLPNAEQCAHHDRGWAHYLGRLAIASTGRDPGPDPGPPPQA
ncbi:MAG: SRPBCC domain-containing protein, partial [Planctomycetaceae bacterium]|nr:SRPBCC domain-containing protein [Planctomycetaceae bacterium]